MDAAQHRAIDADLHLPLPTVRQLVPHLDPYWADQVVRRNIDRAPFALTAYPPRAPLTCREDWRGLSSPAEVIAHGLDPFGSAIAIGSHLHGVVALNNPDMAAALVAAVNDHMRTAWLDASPRLRGSILVSLEDPALAVAEIERLAPDPRFVQVLVPLMAEAPIARRVYWPILAAAERHGLALAVHAGSLYRHAPAVSGWPSHQFEDYVLQGPGFENLVLALLAEGVFGKFPRLKVVLLEAGFMWLPTLLWRIDKTWRDVRPEVPWIDRPPSEILKGRLFWTLQPVDAPGPAELSRTLAMIARRLGGLDWLLFATDWPHRQFAGARALPEGLPAAALPAILAGNALAAYPRLAADPAARALAGQKEAAT
ncbi:MAG: amidohydrolase [Alphaproteobacteria bacterium]|nr:MAG: amidohydrolase [Alphaproteobacteria bacterium]